MPNRENKDVWKPSRRAWRPKYQYECSEFLVSENFRMPLQKHTETGISTTVDSVALGKDQNPVAYLATYSKTNPLAAFLELLQLLPNRKTIVRSVRLHPTRVAGFSDPPSARRNHSRVTAYLVLLVLARVDSSVHPPQPRSLSQVTIHLGVVFLGDKGLSSRKVVGSLEAPPLHNRALECLDRPHNRKATAFSHRKTHSNRRAVDYLGRPYNPKLQIFLVDHLLRRNPLLRSCKPMNWTWRHYIDALR